jgi:cytochrome c oxidase subunit 3
MEFNSKRFQSHPYHLVNSSFWPLFASLSGFLLVSGTSLYLHNYLNGFFFFCFGFFSVLFIMFLWWRDVINEALLGFHTKVVQKGLKYGMILFIVSEVMFFFGFFWAFFHSSLAPTVEIGCVWPPKGINVFHPFQIPLLNTMLLLLSGISITWSHHAMMANNSKESENALLITILLAIIFTACQVFEYIEATFTISDGVYGTTFYVTTGLHGLHVLVGTIFLAVCFFRHKKKHFLPTHHVGYLSAIWYWHFVDVVWLFLYLFIYCWGGYSVSILFFYN